MTLGWREAARPRPPAKTAVVNGARNYMTYDNYDNIESQPRKPGCGRSRQGNSEMTVFEHPMFGASLALLAGVRRRHGWGLIATAAAAAALPDWDGLSILFGSNAYAAAHRVWGHNLLVAGLGGAVVGIVGLLAARSVRVRALLTRPAAELPPPPPRSAATV